MKLKRTLVAIAAAAALGAPAAAHADRASVLRLVGMVAVAFGQGWGYVLIAGASVQQAADTRRNFRRQLAERRRKAAEQLQSRNISALTSEPARRKGYGRCVSGGDVVAMFTTDGAGTDEFGNIVTKPDALQHLVIRFHSGQAQAIHEVFVDGVAVGPLDASGYPTGGDFYSSETKTMSLLVATGGTVTLPADARPALSVVSAIYNSGTTVDPIYNDAGGTIAGDGNSITVGGSGSFTVTLTYTYAKLNHGVRISKFLGAPSQAVDPYLNGLLPAKWTADHRLRGQAGIVITLNLQDQRFQSGIPNITAEGTWSLVYDPRKDSTQPGGSGAHRYGDPTTWDAAGNANPALCTVDFLCSEEGYGCDPASDIDWPSVIAAANACDQPATFDDGAGPYTAPRYTCNGVFTTSDSREAVLEDLTESMAGAAIPGAQWQVMAGTWTPPVDTLTDDDLAGSIEIVQADTPIESLLNSARGRYIPAGKSAPTEANPPYTNPTLVAADENTALWEDFSFPYTSSNARVRDLLRIKVEQRRSGLLITYPAKVRKWGLRVGERVNVISSTYGWPAPGKTFRITDRRYALPAPVHLALQEDDASVWDQADAATADPTPNTGLPNPYTVQPLSGFTVASSESTALRLADGTWQPTVEVSWSPITDRNSLPDGQVELRWVNLGPLEVGEAAPVRADGQPRAVITGVRERDRLLVYGRVRNRHGRTSTEVFAPVTVVGKTTPPATPTVTATPQPGGVAIVVNTALAADQRRVEIRYGATWTGGTQLYAGDASSFEWRWPPVGTHTIRAKVYDRSGNPSAEGTASVTVTSTNTLISTPELGDGAASVIAGANQVGSSTLYLAETDILTLTIDPADYPLLLSATVTAEGGYSARDVTFKLKVDGVTQLTRTYTPVGDSGSPGNPWGLYGLMLQFVVNAPGTGTKTVKLTAIGSDAVYSVSVRECNLYAEVKKK